MAEIINPNEPMYDGDMTAGEWLEAEVKISYELPAFEHPALATDKLRTPHGEIQLHHFNTDVVVYQGQFEHMSHIRVDREESPFYYFRDTGTRKDEAKDWTGIANHLLGRDYKQSIPPERPHPFVFHMYWQGVRGGETIEAVIERLLN